MISKPNPSIDPWIRSNAFWMESSEIWVGGIRLSKSDLHSSKSNSQTLSFLYQARIHPLEQRRLFVYPRPLIARLCGLHLALTGLSTRRDTCLSITWLVSTLAVKCWLEKHDENIEGLAWWRVLMPLWCSKDTVFPSLMCSSVSQLLFQLRY